MKQFVQFLLVAVLLFSNISEFLCSSENSLSCSPPLSCTGTDEANTATLEQVQIIFRHGLRSPEKSYPGDPYHDEKFWPHGWGMLTNEGKRQQYQLGQLIRRRYKDFLSDEYSSAEFYALSSDSDRAIMSLQANLAGLFPPTQQDRWSDVLTSWQPIPMRTISKGDDKIIRGSAPCPKFDRLWNDLLKTEEFRKANNKYRDLYNYIGNHTGEKYTYPIDLTTFYEALMIEEAHNLSLPEWTRKVYPTEMSTNFLNFAFSLVAYTEPMKRLRGGPLLQQLLTNINFKAQADPRAKKMILFSGHDITMARIMDTMNVFTPHLPDFNSALFIELHKGPSDTPDDYYIDIYYRNGAREIQMLTVNGCLPPCSLSTFKNLTQSRVISDRDWIKECSDIRSDPINFLSQTISLYSNFHSYVQQWLV